MTQVNIHEAKTHLSALLEDVRKGESFVIAKAGTPVAVVSPYQEEAKPARRRTGFMKGQIKVPENFDTMMQNEIIALFEGASEEELAEAIRKDEEAERLFYEQKQAEQRKVAE
jgi:prevent-host-death family protein